MPYANCRLDADARRTRRHTRTRTCTMYMLKESCLLLVERLGTASFVCRLLATIVGWRYTISLWSPLRGTEQARSYCPFFVALGTRRAGRREGRIERWEFMECWIRSTIIVRGFANPWYSESSRPQAREGFRSDIGFVGGGQQHRPKQESVSQRLSRGVKSVV